MTAPPAPVELDEPETADVTALDRPWVTLVWNDPVNLMSYVSYVFRTYFEYSKAYADKLMWQGHAEGRAGGAPGNPGGRGGGGGAAASGGGGGPPRGGRGCPPATARRWSATCRRCTATGCGRPCSEPTSEGLQAPAR